VRERRAARSGARQLRRERRAEPRGDAAGERAGGGDGDLLAEDRAEGELEAAHRAGDAEAGARGDEWPEHGVGGEHGDDRSRVLVEAEQVADQGNDLGLVGGR
jgi:hypothetical protein